MPSLHSGKQNEGRGSGKDGDVVLFASLDRLPERGVSKETHSQVGRGEWNHQVAQSTKGHYESNLCNSERLAPIWAHGLFLKVILTLASSCLWVLKLSPNEVLFSKPKPATILPLSLSKILNCLKIRADE